MLSVFYGYRNFYSLGSVRILIALTTRFSLSFGLVLVCQDIVAAQSTNQYIVNSPCSTQVMNSPNTYINRPCTAHVYVEGGNDVTFINHQNSIPARVGRMATEQPVYSITETQREGRMPTEQELSPIVSLSGRVVD